jgi:hypothetical protein
LPGGSVKVNNIKNSFIPDDSVKIGMKREAKVRPDFEKTWFVLAEGTTLKQGWLRILTHQKLSPQLQLLFNI